MNAAAEVDRPVRLECVALLMGTVFPRIDRDAGADVIYSYCGTSDEYCGDGCQAAFGTCSTNLKRIRSHVRRHNHVMRMKRLNL